MTISAEEGKAVQIQFSYEVISITNPKGGIESPGNTSNLCVLTNELRISKLRLDENTLDTKYMGFFGTGTPIISILKRN
jgi:hypothetical protein